MKKIGLIVVHGVGEQKRYEFLESVACNLFRALRCDKKRKDKAYIQLRRGDQAPHLSEEESWREAPALIRWQDDDGDDVEIQMREVHWADLDEKMTWMNWLKLVFWGLGISGIKLFDKASVGHPGLHGMCPPNKLDDKQRVMVRLQLFAVSLLFFLTIFTVDIIYFVVSRLGFRPKILRDLRGIIYNYLGDVKLYQDGTVRHDSLEVIGEKSRVAIRKRMIQALVKTAEEVKSGELDDYFIFAHSLGTLVAFNGLMETAVALPDYLTEKQWLELPAGLKTQADGKAPDIQMPRRPPWLSDDDAIDRQQLFEGFRGLVTMGSPLDKFAALWPAIVPVNSEPVPGNRPWINVADVQDIVGASIDMFTGCNQGSGIGGLKLTNVEWACEKSLITAHTKYWGKKNGKPGNNAGKNRLIDCLIPWFEGKTFIRPEDCIDKAVAKRIYMVSFPVIAVLLMWMFGSACWLFTKSGAILEMLAKKTLAVAQFPANTLSNILCDGSYWSSVACGMVCIFLAAILIVSICSIARYVSETYCQK